MARNAVVYTLTGSVLRMGYTDFTTDGSFDATTETQVPLNDETVPPAGVDLKYVKVVAGDLVEMTASEQHLVDQVFPPTVSSALPVPQLVDGYTSTASTNLTVIRGTTYNEQTTNAKRSLVSSNVNDSGAGTGARQIQIRYYDEDMVGPFFETVTLNGTTAVNTQASDICFIERLDVVVVGSQLGNQGTITLKTAINGGGSDIGSIAPGDNETNWCHHYVPHLDPSKLSEVTGTNKGAASGDLFVRVAYPTQAGKPDTTILIPIRLPPGETVVYQPEPPVQVLGPSRITLFIKPLSAASTDWAASLNYYEDN